MQATKMTVKVTHRSAYDTTSGAYKPTAALTCNKELVVSFMPQAPGADGQEPIVVRFTPFETTLIRRALKC